VNDLAVSRYLVVSFLVYSTTLHSVHRSCKLCVLIKSVIRCQLLLLYNCCLSDFHSYISLMYISQLQSFCLQCFDAVGWVAGRASSLQKNEWWGAAVVICLELGADLHTAQLMPLPLTVCCFSKILHFLSCIVYKVCRLSVTTE